MSRMFTAALYTAAQDGNSRMDKYTAICIHRMELSTHCACIGYNMNGICRHNTEQTEAKHKRTHRVILFTFT